MTFKLEDLTKQSQNATKNGQAFPEVLMDSLLELCPLCARFMSVMVELWLAALYSRRF